MHTPCLAEFVIQTGSLTVDALSRSGGGRFPASGDTILATVFRKAADTPRETRIAIQLP